MKVMKRAFSQSNIPLLLAILTMIQPILDMLTSLGMEFEHTVTVGVVARMLLFAVAFFYVMFCRPFPHSKAVRIYLWILTAYGAVFLGYMLYCGGVSACLGNIKNMAKTFSLPYVLAMFFALYQKYRTSVSYKTLWITLSIYTVSVVLAYLTNTSLCSYRASGYGFSGWFSAATELSNIISLITPLGVYYCLTRLELRWKWEYLLFAVGLLSLCVVSNLIATKLVFGAVALFFVLAGFWSLLSALRAKEGRGDQILRCVVCLVCAGLMIWLYSASPLRAYINEVYVPMQDETSDIYQASLEKSEGQMSHSDTWLGHLIAENPTVDKLNGFLSLRLTFMAPDVQAYLESTPAAKLLGIGYAKMPRYPQNIGRLIEMDLIAVLIRHGVLGLLLYYMPFILLAGWVVVRFLRHPVIHFRSLRCCICTYSFLLAFFISMIVGHVVNAPPVSYFLAVIIVKVYEDAAEDAPPPMSQSAKESL